MKIFINLIISILIIIAGASCSSEQYDIVIKNGMVYDGDENRLVQKEIGITGSYIMKTGDELTTKGARVIDAENLIVSPGFIDIHTHCDSKILKKGNNTVKNYLTQGVTTVVTGNCGGGTYEVENFFDKLDSIGTGTNIVHLTGHNTIRRKVMGMDDREPTAEELEQMKELVRKAMKEGAGGMSTGLFYLPGNYSSVEEIIDLAGVVKEYEGFYASHIRDESNYTVGLENAIEEAISVGEQTGIRVEISHIKALGRPVWGMSEKICSIIEGARDRGVQVYADQYPYNASATGLAAATLQGWVSAGGKLRERLNDPELLPRIKEEMAENIDRRGGPESMIIVSYPKEEDYNGKDLLEISRILNKPVVETVIYLILNGSPGIISFNMQDSDVTTFMKKDYVMTCSDGNIAIPGEGDPHPRCYGTFPRKIRKYVLEDEIISMEHAIRAATSLPANMIGLKQRGCIKEGYIADIVIFDPEAIRDMATFDDPHQYSEGVEYLLVNGDVVIDEGQYNSKLRGKAIRFND